VRRRRERLDLGHDGHDAVPDVMGRTTPIALPPPSGDLSSAGDRGRPPVVSAWPPPNVVPLADVCGLGGTSGPVDAASPAVRTARAAAAPRAAAAAAAWLRRLLLLLLRVHVWLEGAVGAVEQVLGGGELGVVEPVLRMEGRESFECSADGHFDACQVPRPPTSHALSGGEAWCSPAVSSTV